MRPRRTGLDDHGPMTPDLLDLHGHGSEVLLDEDLHHGRSWHRFDYCYRRTVPLRVLDAGCGTGQSTVAAARLNSEALVLGVDHSPTWVRLARERAVVEGLDTLDFAVHDLELPVPADWGSFDFVICREVLGQARDPARLLAQLARCLDPCGLLLATFPSREGRRPHRALRQAIDALVAPDAGLEERTRTGLDLLQGLRPDHPMLALLGPPRPVMVDAPQAAPQRPSPTSNGPQRLVLDCLTNQHDWSLDEATALLERAGLRLLYAAVPRRWHADRVFGPGPLTEALRNRLDRLRPGRLSRLVDALDPAALEAEYHLYACPATYQPVVPSWPQTRRADPASFGRLVPHLTGLARPEKGLSTTSAAQGRFLFRTVSGTIGELDRLAVLRLAAVDGNSTCGAIDEKLTSRTRASDDDSVHQDCWINLADLGLILLEPPAGA